MARITERFVNTGTGQRIKSHKTVAVEIDLFLGVEGGVELRATNKNFDHQYLHLTKREVDLLTVQLCRYCSEPVKKYLLASLLKKLSDSQLVRLMAIVLRPRFRLTKKELSL